MFRIDAHDSEGVGAICLVCRSGGTGRRTGLKILRDLYSRTGSIPVCGISKRWEKCWIYNVSLIFCFKKVEPLMECWLMEKHEQGNKFQILEKL